MKISEFFKIIRTGLLKNRVKSTIFQKLSNDHNPEILYISCSDNRASSEELMDAQLGFNVLKTSDVQLAFRKDN